MTQQEITEKKDDILKIEDVLPEKPEFYLASKKKTYTLRVVNLQDQVWIKQTFGGPEKILEMFNKKDWSEIFKFAYRLLEDKSDFQGEEQEIENDDGFKEMARITGPQKLLQATTGLMEAVHVLGACNTSFALGEPIMGEYMRKELKKKVDQFKKRQTGQKSLTSSQANTVTPPMNLDV